MKSAVYSWRLDAEKKVDLEAELYRDGVTIAKLLDDLTTEWLRQRRNGRANDDAEQAAIRRRAARAIGACTGGNPAASERSRELVGEAIYQNYLKEANASNDRHSRRSR
jgi:hypothetical protein